MTNFFQVQTDCSTPALANFGSEKLKRDFLVPALAGDMVTSIAVLVVKKKIPKFELIKGE